MVAAIIGGLIRALASAVGGGLVISDTDLNAILGALTLVVTVLWSAYSNYKKTK